MRKIIIILLIIAFLTPVAVYAQDNQQGSQDSARGEGYNPQYNTIPIIVGLIIFYLVTYLLFDAKYIRRGTFKQIWSVILVGTFLFSGITGIILTILSDYNLQFPLNFNLLFWHVESGVILAISIILHIHIHIKPIKKVIKGSI